MEKRSSLKSVFLKGHIAGWESDYIDVMRYQFVCYDDFNQDEVYDWCLFNLGANMNWMVTMNGVIMRKEDDAILFTLAWC